jgi:hypothetical protein
VPGDGGAEGGADDGAGDTGVGGDGQGIAGAVVQPGQDLGVGPGLPSGWVRWQWVKSACQVSLGRVAANRWYEDLGRPPPSPRHRRRVFMYRL